MIRKRCFLFVIPEQDDSRNLSFFLRLFRSFCVTLRKEFVGTYF